MNLPQHPGRICGWWWNLSVGVHMSHPKFKAGRRRYRLSGGKMAAALLALGVFAALIVAAILLLQEKGTVAFTAETATPVYSVVQLETVSPSDTQEASASPSASKKQWLVVVDAGHGDFDPGCIGISGVHEADLNLSVAEYLQEALEAQGLEVVMTRESDVGLGTTQNESLRERGRIIVESGADMVISVHMNSFPQDPDVSGPLVLFAPGSQYGEELAGRVQHSLNDALSTDGKARSQDLYVLQQGTPYAVLVECGYLSNEAEERNLQDSAYQQRIAQAICDGAIAYISQEG